MTDLEMSGTLLGSDAAIANIAAISGARPPDDPAAPYWQAGIGFNPTVCAFCGTPPKGTKLIQTWEQFWVCDWHERQYTPDAKTIKEILRGFSKRVRGRKVNR
jgi:hypothetical protein